MKQLESLETGCGGNSGESHFECRRCKALKEMPNLSGKRTEKLLFLKGITVCFFGVTDIQ
jgi:hypothetical protein